MLAKDADFSSVLTFFKGGGGIVLPESSVFSAFGLLDAVLSSRRKTFFLLFDAFSLVRPPKRKRSNNQEQVFRSDKKKQGSKSSCARHPGPAEVQKALQRAA